MFTNAIMMYKPGYLVGSEVSDSTVKLLMVHS